MNFGIIAVIFSFSFFCLVVGEVVLNYLDNFNKNPVTNLKIFKTIFIICFVEPFGELKEIKFVNIFGKSLVFIMQLIIGTIIFVILVIGSVLALILTIISLPIFFIITVGVKEKQKKTEL